MGEPSHVITEDRARWEARQKSNYKQKIKFIEIIGIILIIASLSIFISDQIIWGALLLGLGVFILSKSYKKSRKEILRTRKQGQREVKRIDNGKSRYHKRSKGKNRRSRHSSRKRRRR